MLDNRFKYAEILVVDDQQNNIDLLERILQRAGYCNLTSTTDPCQVRTLYTKVQPDLIILDLHMPQMDGFAVLEQLMTQIPQGTYLPILMLTADIAPEAKQRALANGAKDFLTKPFNRVETLLRIKNLLETRFLHLQIQQQNLMLEEKVRERTHKLEQAQLEILQRLARAAEYRDDTTGQHTQRVGETAAHLAEALGLPAIEVEMIRWGAPLHDVGKIAIPDLILLKEGKLTPVEFEVMKSHTTIGGALLGESQFPILQIAEQIALTHHERWDGQGYPYGLRAEAIPLVGRIVSVADVFDALTHERPYKAAWSVDEAVAELQRQKGHQFDPDVVDAFVQVIEEVYAVS